MCYLVLKYVVHVIVFRQRVCVMLWMCFFGFFRFLFLYHIKAQIQIFDRYFFTDDPVTYTIIQYHIIKYYILHHILRNNIILFEKCYSIWFLIIRVGLIWYIIYEQLRLSRKFEWDTCRTKFLSIRDPGDQALYLKLIVCFKSKVTWT